MTDTRSYREQSRAARHAARTRLQEFRAARRAKRAKLFEPASTMPSESAAASPFTVDPGLLYAAPSTSDDAEAPTPETGQDVDTPQSSTDDAGLAPDPDDGVVEAEPPVSARPVTEQPIGPAEESRSDLASLPGAGEGMVLLLNQCGIHSLADLARADPAELSQHLGIVGQILDVTPWIDYARTKSTEG